MVSFKAKDPKIDYLSNVSLWLWHLSLLSSIWFYFLSLFKVFKVQNFRKKGHGYGCLQLNIINIYYKSSLKRPLKLIRWILKIYFWLFISGFSEIDLGNNQGQIQAQMNLYRTAEFSHQLSTYFHMDAVSKFFIKISLDSRDLSPLARNCWATQRFFFILIHFNPHAVEIWTFKWCNIDNCRRT